jgi:hypothetical protein
MAVVMINSGAKSNLNGASKKPIQEVIEKKSKAIAN